MKNFLAILLCCLLQYNGRAQDYRQEKIVIVAGHILNLIGDIKKISLAINRIGFIQESLETEVDSVGNFLFRFNTYIPTDAWLTYQTNFLILAHPGDSIYVEFDGNSKERSTILKTIKFSGDGFKTNKQAAEFQSHYFSSILYTSWELKGKAVRKYEPERFKIFEDSLNGFRENIYDKFIRTSSPSQEVRAWARFFLKEAHFNNLTFYPDSHRKALALKQNEWNVPTSYYDFLEENESIEKSLISAAAISGYTNKYLYHYIRLNAQEKLRNEIKKKTFPVNDSILVQTLLERTPNKLLREIALTQFLNDLLNQSDLEGFERFRLSAYSIIHEPFLREPLQRKYRQAKAELTNLTLNHNALLASSSYGGDPIAKIIKDNASKIIYLDIWATWCGPCREEFPYSLKLQKEFSNDVVFVFICIDSEKSAYINALKKYQLQGQLYFLSPMESSLLKKNYRLEGIPHYALINKDGEIAFEGYDLKPSENSTREKIASIIGKK